MPSAIDAIMRANYRMQRLYLEDALAPETPVEAAPQAAHYLTHGLRLKEGEEVLVFKGATVNGRPG